MDTRPQIVAWAKWGVANKSGFFYSEGSDRMESIGHKPVKLPVHCDCSAFVRLCYYLADAPDPMGLGYKIPEGYTGTLLSRGKEIPLSQIKVGDIIVYGPGTGWHTALIVDVGNDPLTVSMGQQGDPSLVKVSQDGRQPQRYLRFNTAKVGIVKRIIRKILPRRKFSPIHPAYQRPPAVG